MNRERALKFVMVLVGLLFVAAIYPVAMALWHPSPSDDTGDTMMMSLYFTLGVFLLVAARKPSAHRSLIAFTAWSSFAHATVMAILGFHIPNEKTGFLIGSAVLVVIGVALLALAPAKQSVEQVSAARA
jgi:peptidoglycan/LPS O-acetylase OafA/YrhL